MTTPPPKTPTTPSQDKPSPITDREVFDHITKNIFGCSDERAEYLEKWMRHHGFEHILHVLDHVATDPEGVIKELTQYKTGKQVHELQASTRQQIKLMAYWLLQQRKSVRGKIPRGIWMNLTKDEYDDWRINTDFTRSFANQEPVSPLKSPTHSTQSHTTSSTTSQSMLDLSAFKKGTKRDATAFETFKDERYFDSFWRVFKSTAKAQGLSNVLDFKYKIPEDDEYAELLFHEQQVFMYSVLVRIIQTDQGRAYVREHEHDEDARAVLEKLYILHTKSDLAKREVLRLTNYISNLRLDDSWRGTTRQFLLHFQEQLQLLDNLVPISDRIHDHTRVSFLMQTVEKVPDLRRVKILDNVVNTKSGAKALCYQSYFRLLLDAAYDHDQATRTSTSNTRRRHVKQHESQQDDPYDMIEPTDYKVNNTNIQTEKPSVSLKISLPCDVWFKLSEEDRQIIVDFNKAVQDSPSSARKVKMHSLDTDPEPDPDPDDVNHDDLQQDSPEDPHDPSSDPITQFVHQAITTTDINYPASDLSNILSTSTSKTSPKVTFKSSDRKQKIHMSRYLFSRKSTFSGNQLIDRGANGGLAGSDMRILAKTGRHITIVGIDNHELTGLPVVTCAAKFDTSDGPIIGIFNEYAHYGKGLSIHSPAQFEHFGLSVDERSVKVDGKQRITTLDGRALPLRIKDGLAYIQSLGIPSDDDMDKYLHIVFTSPHVWDPSVLDHTHPDPQRYG